MSTPAAPNKYIKIKIHHLSEYIINLWASNGIPYCLDAELVTENFSDSTKKVKVRHVDMISISDDALSPLFPYSYKRTVSYNTDTWCHSDSNQYPYDPELFTFYFDGFTGNIDAILLINSKIKELKTHRKNGVVTKLEHKQAIKDLEASRSLYKANIKSLLSSLFHSNPQLNPNVVELESTATII